MSLIAELKRRNVFKVAAAYVVVSWLVMQITDTLGDALGLPDTLAKYVFVLLVAGFPVALFLAWAYELTPEGVKKAEEVDKDESITHVTGQKINYLIIGLMAIALGYFIWKDQAASPAVEVVQPEPETAQSAAPQKAVEPAATEQEAVSQASIAVLPFADLSQEKDQEYFTDGISEELLNLLAGVSHLKVTSRTSAFSFKGSKKKLSEIARELKVAHILEGSIRKAGDTIRITAQLIRASDDAHLWSSTYDRKLENIFAIQDEIANAIVDALMPHLGMTAKPKVKTLQSTNPEAHRLTLQGRHLMRNKRNPSGLREAEVHLRKAVELDANFAPALAALAENLILQVSYVDVNFTEYMKDAYQHLQRARQLDPMLPEVYGVLGLYHRDAGQMDEALVALDRAIELNPSYSEALQWKGNSLEELYQLAEALALRKQAYENDPLFPLAIHNYARSLLARGRLEDVEALQQRLAEISPVRGLRLGAELADASGQPLKAIEFRLEEISRNPDGLMELFASFNFRDMGLEEQIAGFVQSSVYTQMLQYQENRDDQALQMLAGEMMAEDPDNRFKAWFAAGAYVLLGKHELACRIFDRFWNRDAKSPKLSRLPWWTMSDYARCLLETGQQERAGEILDLMEYQLQKEEEAAFTWFYSAGKRFNWLLLRGEHEKALQWLEKIYRDAPVMLSPADPIRRYAPELAENPEYRELADRIYQKNHAYGLEFMRRVCKENPWASAWKPVPGSCEKLEVRP